MTDRNRLVTAGSRVRLRLASDDRLVASVRRGDTVAFEAIYERHAGELLSFCVYMLGSRHDAEDAVQATFASAYRALRADRRPVTLRPWLFTIARNDCLSILRGRRPTVELNGEPALGGDPFRELEVREEVRQMFEGLRELPESQRAALVLAELHGLSQAEIGVVLGIRPEQVKAYVYQARSNLISEKRAREADCREIREELATARGGALLRGRLRRHVRSCAECRVYADGVARQRRQLGALLPLTPSLVLRYRALEEALAGGAVDPATYAGGAAIGGSVAGAAVEVAGGGVKALAVKVAAGMACLGGCAGVGASVISAPVTSQVPAPQASIAAEHRHLALLASVAPANTVGWSSANLVGESPQVGGGSTPGATQDSQPSPSTLVHGFRSVPSRVPGAGGGGSGKEHGKGQETQRAGEEDTSKNGERPRESEEERLQEIDERERSNRERELKGEERKLTAEERQRKGEERQRQREEHLRTLEERHPGGGSRPPRTEEERQKQREKREEKRAGGGSRPPRTEEERQKKRELRRREREEGG